MQDEPAPDPESEPESEREARPLAWLPNALTLARVALAPAILFALIAPSIGVEQYERMLTAGPPIAAGLIALAGVLDWLDGRLARALRVESAFGRFWDPIADKLVIGAGLLGGAFVLSSMLFVLPAAMIVWRDGFVSWLRARPSNSAAAISNPLTLAKWKTAAEFAALLVIFGATPLLYAQATERLAGISLAIGLVVLWLAAALALWTGWRYAAAVREAGKSEV